MKAILKKILISVLFLASICLTFYFLKEIIFLGKLLGYNLGSWFIGTASPGGQAASLLSVPLFLAVFFIPLLFSVTLFVFLVLTFSCSSREAFFFKKKQEDKQEGEEKKFLIEKKKESLIEKQEDRIKKEVEKIEEKERENLKFSQNKFSFLWLFFVCFLASGLFYLFFLSFVSPENTIYFIIGTLLFFVFLCFGAKSIRNEKNVLLKFKFFRISHKGFEKIFTGIAVLIAILFFLSPKIIGGEITLPPSLFDVLWNGAGTPQSSFFLPGLGLYFGFSEDMTVDEYLLLQASELLSKFKDSNQTEAAISLPFEKDPIEIKIGMSEEEFKEEVLKEGRKRFSVMIGKEVKGDENIKNIFYEIASERVSEIIEPYKQVGAIGLIFIFFLSSRMVLMIFSYVCLPFAWVLFKLFKAVKFFEIKKTKVDKEILTL